MDWWFRLAGNDGRYSVTYTAGIEWTDEDPSQGAHFCHTRIEKADKGLNQMIEVVSHKPKSLCCLSLSLLMKHALRKCSYG